MVPRNVHRVTAKSSYPDHRVQASQKSCTMNTFWITSSLSLLSTFHIISMMLSAENLFIFTCISEGSSSSPPSTFEVLALVLFHGTHLGQSWLRCPNCLQVKHFPVFINSIRSSVVNCQALARSTSIAFGSLAFGQYDWKACCHCSFVFLQGLACLPSKLDWTSKYFC